MGLNETIRSSSSGVRIYNIGCSYVIIVYHASGVVILQCLLHLRCANKSNRGHV